MISGFVRHHGLGENWPRPRLHTRACSPCSSLQQLSSIHDIIHLMYGPEGNSLFCFPESLDVSRDEVEGNIRTRGKTKLTSVPRAQTLSALLYI